MRYLKLADTNLVPWEQRKDKNGVEIMEGYTQSEERELKDGTWTHIVFTTEPASGEFSHLMILRKYIDGKLVHWETRLP